MLNTNNTMADKRKLKTRVSVHPVNSDSRGCSVKTMAEILLLLNFPSALCIPMHTHAPNK